MFTAIGLMLTGIALGFALRSFQWPTIMLMLFALGVAVGGNETLMANLPVLGGKALVLTVACVAGSLICTVAVRRFFPGAGPQRHAAAEADGADVGTAMSVRHDREDGEGRA